MLINGEFVETFLDRDLEECEAGALLYPHAREMIEHAERCVICLRNMVRVANEHAGHPLILNDTEPD